MLLTAVAALGWQLVTIAVPVVLGRVTDAAIGRGDLGALWWGAGAVVALALAEAVLDGWRHRLENGASAGYAGRLRRRVLRGALAGGTGHEPGDLVSRGTDDADAVAGLVDSAGYTIAFALGVPVALLLIGLVDPLLALLALVAAALGPLAAHLLARVRERRATAAQEAAARAVGLLQAVLGARTAARGLGVQAQLSARLAEHSREIARTATHLAALEPAARTVHALAAAAPVAVVLAAGAPRVPGDVTLGGLVTAVGLALYLGGPLGAVVEQLLELGAVRASARRVAAAAGTGTSPGAAVLLRHDPAFWSDTLRANLDLGRGLDERTLRAVLHDVELTDVVAARPDGLDLRLDDAGRRLSGGQRQRLALARALLHAGSIDVADGLDGVGPAQRERLLAVVRRHEEGA